ILQGFNAMGETLQQSQELNMQTVQAMRVIMEQLAHIGTSATTSPQYVMPAPQPQAIVPTPTNPRGASHFHKPCIFKGKATDVKQFIQDVQDAVHLSRTSLPTEFDHCVYMAMFFDDRSPKQWYTSIKIDETHLLQDFEAFCEAFENHFGNPDVASDANNKLLTLEQTGSAAAYAACYMELLVHIDWSEQTKINNFYHKLKPAVKDTIIMTCSQDQPTYFKDYVNFVIEIDNWVHCHAQERKLEGKATVTTKPTSNSSCIHNLTLTLTTTTTSYPTASSSTTMLPQGIPMEIDAMCIGKPCPPLSKEEKECCQHEGLCSYCRGSGHFASSCPNMSAASKKCFADKASSCQEKA
ncbi:hypothetical protein DXG03_000674, partial [Asterophora parasitica]